MSKESEKKIFLNSVIVEQILQLTFQCHLKFVKWNETNSKNNKREGTLKKKQGDRLCKKVDHFNALHFLKLFKFNLCLNSIGFLFIIICLPPEFHPVLG